MKNHFENWNLMFLIALHRRKQYYSWNHEFKTAWISLIFHPSGPLIGTLLSIDIYHFLGNTSKDFKRKKKSLRQSQKQLNATVFIYYHITFIFQHFRSVDYRIAKTITTFVGGISSGYIVWIQCCESNGWQKGTKSIHVVHLQSHISN